MRDIEGSDVAVAEFVLWSSTQTSGDKIDTRLRQGWQKMWTELVRGWHKAETKLAQNCHKLRLGQNWPEVPARLAWGWDRIGIRAKLVRTKVAWDRGEVDRRLEQCCYVPVKTIPFAAFFFHFSGQIAQLNFFYTETNSHSRVSVLWRSGVCIIRVEIESWILLSLGQSELSVI